ncbi:MAG TPA: TetR/AcrR family transcriptional regulator [Alphaproteobacteria bacterium]
MVQVKKPAQREAILKRAFQLFTRKGFKKTTMAEIAAASNMTVANIYVYFPSKLHLLYEIYRPLLKSQLEALAEEVRAIEAPRDKLRHIFNGIWNTIPAENNGFANNLMQALADEPPRRGKISDLLSWCEDFVTELVRESLPPERRALVSDQRLAHLTWMAFDGFVINWRLGDIRDTEGIVELFCDLLLGEAVAPAMPVPRLAGRRVAAS